MVDGVGEESEGQVRAGSIIIILSSCDCCDGFVKAQVGYIEVAWCVVQNGGGTVNDMFNGVD